MNTWIYYILDEDESEVYFGEANCKNPMKTKVYKEMIKLFLNSADSKGFGYRIKEN